MPSVPMGPIYDQPDLDMELLVFQRGYEPGRATLRTLRSYSANVEAGLDDRLRTETQQRKDADTAETSARQSADNSEAQTRANADASLGQRIDAEASTRAQADATEATARQSADNAEAMARANADAAEVTARTNGDAALQTQITALKNTIVPFPGAVMTLPAGLSILAGKSTRTITITGLKKNDNLVVTPNAALPANISMGEAYCATDGVLTVVLINSATLGLSITTAQTIPLGVIALRP